jgi:hypothetical protein
VHAVHAGFARQLEQPRRAVVGVKKMTFCQRVGDNALHLSRLATVRESIREFPPLNDYSCRYGRGAGVGRGLGVGVPLGVGVGLGVDVGVGVGVAVAVAVGVGVGVGVGLGAAAQYLPPVLVGTPPLPPPHTIISLPVHTPV